MSDPPPPRRWRPSPRWLAPILGVALAPVPVALAIAVGAFALRAGVAVVRRGLEARARAQHRRALLGDPATIMLGREDGGAPVTVAESQLGAHGLILGASGAGKTTTLLTVLDHQIARGRPVVAIDLKGSADFAARLGGAAAAAGRPFRVWSADGHEHWNPLAHGSPTEIKDRLIGTERFSEPHYLRAAERYVQIALTVMAELDPEREASLGAVVELLDPRALALAARELPAGRASQVHGYLRSLGPDQLSAVRGLGSRLAVLSESDAGRLLEPQPGGGAIDLRRALSGEEVVLLSLNSSTYGGTAAQLGTLAVQDLVSAAGARLGQPDRPPATVAIDEFSALGSGQVMALIARGREAGVSVLLATQELADLDRAGRGFRDQVVGSTALKIAHRQDVSASAKAVADLTPSVSRWEHSYSDDGQGPVRVASRLREEPSVSADRIQTLGTGEAVVLTKTPRTRVQLGRMLGPREDGLER
jgi:conjugal transfer pilus assembly protein TraD